MFNTTSSTEGTWTNVKKKLDVYFYKESLKEQTTQNGEPHPLHNLNLKK